MRKLKLAIPFFILFSLLSGLWYWIFSSEIDLLKGRALETLSAVAELKTLEILNWRKNLLAKAYVISDDNPLDQLSETLLSNGNKPLEQEIKGRVTPLMERYGFTDLYVVDPDGKVVYPTGGELAKLDSAEVKALKTSLSTGNPILTDFSRVEKTQKVRIFVVIPVHSVSNPMQMTGGLVLGVDGEASLFPMLSKWPGSSDSAETLLVKRDGDFALIMNNLRGEPGSGGVLRLPLTNTQYPSVRAVLGVPDVGEARTHEGVKVISTFKPVAGTGWYVVTRVNYDEVIKEARLVGVITGCLFATLMGLYFLGLLTKLGRDEKERLAKKLAEDSIRMAEAERYEVTLVSIGDGVIATGRSGAVEFMNPVAEALTGYTISEARGKPLEDIFYIFNQETRVLVKNPIREVIERGLVVGLANHTILRARNGVERPIADSAAPIRDQAGVLIGVVLVFRDQSEEYETRRVLAESEERYRTIFNGMMEGFALHEIILDENDNPVDYRFLAVNPAFEKITGLKAAQITGKRVLEVIPDLEERWIKSYGNVALTGEPITFRDYNTSLDKHFEVYAYRPGRGRFATLFRDISEFVNTSEALQKRVLALTQPAGDLENLKFSDLFDIDEIQRVQDGFAKATGVASIITDMEGKPITRPSNFTRLCLDVIRATPKGLGNCMKSDAALGANNPNGPTISRCASGGLFDAGAAITVRGVQVGNWLIGQVRDDSKTEEEARRYAREIGADEEDYLAALSEVHKMSLERFKEVADHLHVLAGQLSSMAFQNAAQARFIADRQRAEEEKLRLTERLTQSHRLESVGKLAGGVAHDFNNMLSVIMGHTEIVMGEMSQDDPNYDDLKEIMKAATRSSEITKQLLAFARKQSVNPRMVDLNDAISSSLKMIKRLIGEDIEVDWLPGKDLGKVWIDPMQMDQIMANLSTNARDAIGGVGKITIRTENCDMGDIRSNVEGEIPSGEYIRITVSDNGCGMTEEERSRIFEPFYTTKSLGEGTGLGLATVYGIIRQNGGYINVYSEKGHGSTFRIYFQKFTGVAEPAPKVKAVLHGGTETVLLVEDEPGILNLGRRVLQSLGYNVLPANSPAEALEVAKHHGGKIDLLITDLIMPDMNGRKLSELLSADYPGLKILFMSGYTADIIAGHGVLEEGTNFIPKPFTIQQLGAKVREVLGRPA